MDSEPPLFDFLSKIDFLPLVVLLTALPVLILVLLFLLICSALVSGSEVAFFSLSKQDLENLRNDKSKTAHRILQLRSTSKRLLATILIANNIINVAIVILSVYVLSRIIPEDTFLRWSVTLAEMPVLRSFSPAGISQIISFLLTIICVTFLLILFGEVVPRVYAKLNMIRLAKLMSGPLQFLVGLLAPLSGILVGWTRFIEHKMARRSNGAATDAAIKEDIDKAIELAIPRDENSRLEADILKSIIKFNDVPVKQIMRSRMDVIAIDNQMPFTKLKEIVRREGYSRMPVYSENLDNVLGILYVKDLIGNMDSGDEFEWQTLLRPQVVYVPESKKINELLKEFQKEHMHMGIVIDEYGGTAGIVTLEDVMEEVIGEIRDEFDEAVEGDYRKIDHQTFLFEGKVLLNDVSRIIGIDSSVFDQVRGDSDSLAGLILEMSGRMPERGEEFSVAGIAMTVIAVTPRRIEKIRVRLNQQVRNLKSLQS